jgi:hypothetical protein
VFLAMAGSASAQEGGRRPFEHRRHESVTCTTCHGTGQDHRTYLIRTARDCAGCHHDKRRAQPCADCHDARAIAPRSIPATMSFTPIPGERIRALPFRHDTHLQPGKAAACQDCHTAPVTLAVARECASCHVKHHRPDADCTSCHVKAPVGTHTDRVHLSCSGSGCHAEAAAPPATLSRSVCLACHTEQKDHEPRGDCATCHRIPSRARLGERQGSWPPADARTPP